MAPARPPLISRLLHRVLGSGQPDLSFLRGDTERWYSLRQRALDLHPNRDHPRALLDEALLHLDRGDRRRAVSTLVRASASPDADALVDIYLSVLLELDDDARAALARAEAERRWRDSKDGLEREFELSRQRVSGGPFSNLRGPR